MPKLLGLLNDACVTSNEGVTVYEIYEIGTGLVTLKVAGKTRITFKVGKKKRTAATAEGKRRAGIQRMRPGWSHLREGAMARLLSRGAGWQGDKSFGFAGLPIGQTERSFSFLFVSVTTWRLV